MLMSYFLTEEYIERVLLQMEKVRKGDYYVDMAVAWCLATARAKFDERTQEFLRNATLTPSVIKKYEQKVTDVGDHLYIVAALALDGIAEVQCVFLAVTVRDEEGAVGGILGGFDELVSQRIQRCLAAANGTDLNEVTFIVHVHDGLDVEHTAHKSHSGADAAAALEVNQIFYREPVSQLGEDFIGVSRGFLNGCTGILLVHNQLDEQTFTGGGAEGIDGDDLTIGIFFS